MLSINVVDLNDKHPVVNILDVSGTGASPSLLEETKAGVDVATIRVSDGDKGANGDVFKLIFFLKRCECVHVEPLF